MKNDLYEVIHEAGVEAHFGLHFVGYTQHLIVEDLDVALQVVLEVLEDAVGTHQILLEELGQGFVVVGE